MIKLPSLQTGYTLVWSGDPALDLPTAPDDASDDERKAVAIERERLLRIARQTGNWPIRPGEQPTVFHFRNLSRSDLTWLTGETSYSTEHTVNGQSRPLSVHESNDLMLRLALEKVENLGTLQVKHARIGSQKRVATPEVINAIHDAGGSDILDEFVLIVSERATKQLDPL